MINARHLRIGGLIEESILNPSTVGPEKIWIPTQTDFYVLSLIIKNPEEGRFRFLEFNEEWLLKFGAKKIDKYTYTFKRLFFHKRKNGIIFNIGKKKVLLRYVHQFQNLVFSLTEEDVTI